MTLKPAMSRCRNWSWTLLAALAGTLLPACSRPAPTTIGGDHAHQRPSHHPGTLAGAGPAIRSRTERLAGTEAAAARNELADILRWLPQLAADTELNRAAWDEVAALAARGSARLGDPGATAAEVAADLAATADRLAAIVATLPAAPGAEEP